MPPPPSRRRARRFASSPNASCRSPPTRARTRQRRHHPTHDGARAAPRPTKRSAMRHVKPRRCSPRPRAAAERDGRRRQRRSAPRARRRAFRLDARSAISRLCRDAMHSDVEALEGWSANTAEADRSTRVRPRDGARQAGNPRGTARARGLRPVPPPSRSCPSRASTQVVADPPAPTPTCDVNRSQCPRHRRHRPQRVTASRRSPRPSKWWKRYRCRPALRRRKAAAAARTASTGGRRAREVSPGREPAPVAQPVQPVLNPSRTSVARRRRLLRDAARCGARRRTARPAPTTACSTATATSWRDTSSVGAEIQ